MMRIYISGAITGREEQARQEFKAAEIRLICEGWDVVNPAELEHAHDLSWESYMREDIAALMDCDFIYRLPGWQSSRGARIESELAAALGIHTVEDPGNFKKNTQANG